eukprot:CAMPEP_0177662434 /NCGR_PEP_ID=MMETSP0447-20121125/19285_1 /TAXON_ID=0 /ORGANISM="Stygamoeba regulata, Strain BSH-02190019" /LENGTH=420 /DNA_ID=CAMNT_0019167993 /DNA_START=21 /DNA_END=1280 /DNA_ORIENTATION=-
MNHPFRSCVRIGLVFLIILLVVLLGHMGRDERGTGASDTPLPQVGDSIRLQPRVQLHPLPQCVQPALDGKLYACTEDPGRTIAWLVPPVAGAHAAFLLFHEAEQRMHLAYFAGHEGASACGIALAALDAGGEQWSTPHIESAESGRSAQNPVLFLASSGAMVLLHTSQKAGQLGVNQKSSRVQRLQRDERMKHWSAPTIVIAEGKGAFLRGPPVRWSETLLMVPVYYTPAGEFDGSGQMSAMLWSHDDCRTFEPSPSSIPGTHDAVGVQPSVTCAGQRCTALMRSRVPGDDGRMFVMRAMSNDSGRHWSAAKPTILPNSNSGIASLLVTPVNPRDAYASHNSTPVLVVAFNGCHGYARTPLVVAASLDDGATFPHMRTIVPASMDGEFSYPSLAFDGARIHLAFTWDRVTIAHTTFTLDW